MSDTGAAFMAGFVSGFVVGSVLAMVSTFSAAANPVKELRSIKAEIVTRGYAIETQLPGGKKAIIWKENTDDGK